MCASSLAHAVDSGFSEHLFQLVTVGLEVGGKGADLGVVSKASRRAEADRLEHLLDLAFGERVAVRELLAHGLGAGAAAGQRSRPSQQLVLALAPAVFPRVIRRDEARGK